MAGYLALLKLHCGSQDRFFFFLSAIMCVLRKWVEVLLHSACSNRFMVMRQQNIWLVRNVATQVEKSVVLARVWALRTHAVMLCVFVFTFPRVFAQSRVLICSCVRFGAQCLLGRHLTGAFWRARSLFVGCADLGMK